MTEFEKIAHARTYIEKLANGINPLTGQPVPEEDVVNQVKISRCLFYVSDLMRQMLEQPVSSRPANNGPKAPFQLSPGQRARFRFSDLPIPISEISSRLNELIDQDQMAKISYRQITDWLLEIGMLTTVESAGERRMKRPTDRGLTMGISMERRQRESGIYTVLLYSRGAQQFVVDNLDAILEFDRQQRAARTAREE